MAIDNKDKKVLKSSIEREQNEVACSAECEKIKGSKNLNVPPLRFPEFSGEWKCTTIGNIGDIKNGPFGSVLHAEDYVENGIPIVTTEHFKTGLMPSDKFGIPQVSNEDYIRLKGYRLETNDIVFSRVGSVDINAHVGIEQNGWLFSGRVLRVRPKYDIDSLFLHYALSTEAVKRDIRNRAVGQTMPSINTPILSSTTIQLPKDLFEQKKVAHFLRLLDERIITQNKIIEDLKKLKSAISKHLFARKDLLETTICLSNIATLKNGYAFQSGKYNALGKWKILTITNVSGERYINDEDYNCIINLPNDIQDHQVLKEGDILISLTGNVGRVSLCKDGDYLLNQRVGLLQLAKNVNQEFLYQILSSQRFENSMIACGQGAAQMNIGKGDVESYVLPYSSNVNNILLVAKILHSYDEYIINEQRKLTLLTMQKQYFLAQMFI
ncbi:restriction endonuclease subunit S [Bacteroides fragilis]|uniref:restriction endonuclease subunit S n=1 Tax=Bacteroides fragilis TaxID=817 RepID=UPI00202F8E08|nr:restriction endonuclease subunit S [Bacteroides fragilis]UVP70362.1 restriction endonuclease subunit S [Bacteroides fragilis]